MGAGADGWSVLVTQFDQTDVLETFACLTSWKHTNAVSQHENVAFDFVSGSQISGWDRRSRPVSVFSHQLIATTCPLTNRPNFDSCSGAAAKS